MIRNGNRRVPPFICPFHQCLGLGNAVHITHLGMTMQLHPFLRRSIHPCAAEVSDLLDPAYRTNGQLTVKTVDGGNAFQLNKGSLLQMLCNFWHLFISQEHFYSDGVCKICNREDQNSLFISDLPCFHIHYLTTNSHLSHNFHNGFQRNRIILHIPSIDNIWIWILTIASTVAPFTFFLKWLLLLRRLQGFTFCFFTGCSFFLAGISCLFLFLVFGFCFLIIQLGMAKHILHLLLYLQGCVFTVFAFSCLNKINVCFQVHTTPFAENLVKILQQDLTFFPGDHRIRQLQLHRFRFRKGDLCPLEQIVFQHIIIFKLKLHAGTVNLHKILRSVLL